MISKLTGRWRLMVPILFLVVAISTTAASVHWINSFILGNVLTHPMDTLNYWSYMPLDAVSFLVLGVVGIMAFGRFLSEVRSYAHAETYVPRIWTSALFAIAPLAALHAMHVLATPFGDMPNTVIWRSVFIVMADVSILLPVAALSDYIEHTRSRPVDHGLYLGRRRLDPQTA